jgi:hypothetical protein
LDPRLIHANYSSLLFQAVQLSLVGAGPTIGILDTFAEMM